MPTLHIDLNDKDVDVLHAVLAREKNDLDISHEPAYQDAVRVLEYVLDNVRDH